VHELDGRLRANLRQTGDFSRIHAMPQGGQDVPDDLDARLVVLRVDHAYSKEPGSLAEIAAKAIHEARGNTPRLYRNALVFLAADKMRLQDLDEAARKFVAWQSILAEKLTLNLDPQQVKQAETQLAAADSAVTARLPETYQWLLMPAQASPQAGITWDAIRLSGQDALAVRASKKLRPDNLLTAFVGTELRKQMDKVPLWRGDHVTVRQLVEDYARYIYLYRLKDPSVLVGAIREGVSLLTWEQDSFAFADSFDEATGRYRGLRAGQQISLANEDSPGLLVKPSVARKQLDAEKAPLLIQTAGELGTVTRGTTSTAPGTLKTGTPMPAPAVQQPKRFHGTVTLDANRVGRDASRIADEVIAHLVGLVGAKVTVTLEIEADIPAGAPENVVRTVTENGRTLKFNSQGFEKD